MFSLIGPTGSAQPFPGSESLDGLEPEPLKASVNDYNPAGLGVAHLISLFATTALSITGMVPNAAPNRRLTLYCRPGSATITLPALSGLSAAPNRFNFASDVALTPNSFAIIMYDITQARWVLVASSPANTAANIQIFNANGNWSKPAGSPKYVRVYLFGGGGGGGGGARVTAGTACSGGGGGGGGGFIDAQFLASDLPATVAVTVGPGGAGGAGSTVDNTAGSNGAPGGNSVFASGVPVTVYGGGAGAGGQIAGGSGGGGGAGTFQGGSNGAAGVGGNGGNLNGVAGGSGGSAGSLTGGAGGSGGGGGSPNAGAGGGGSSTVVTPTGGGGGGGISAAAAQFGGGNGGRVADIQNPAVAANTPGNPGIALTQSNFGGTGGSGAGSNAAGVGAAGGAGIRGGGGGGGGSAIGGNGGAGAAGGTGLVIVLTTF
jgi:hypothetical protein